MTINIKEKEMKKDIRTLEELMNILPNHLHIARNENALKHDRYRIFNMAKGQFLEWGTKTVRELLLRLEKSL